MQVAKLQALAATNALVVGAALVVIASLTASVSGSEAPDSNDAFAFAGRKPSYSSLPPRGLVIYKRHIQADEHAPVIEYSTIRRVVIALDMIRHGGGMVSIPQHQLIEQVVYPIHATDLRTEVQFAQVKHQLDKFVRLADRYRKAAPHLQPWIARMKHEVAMWEDGFCRVDGQWLNRSGYEYQQQVAELRAAFEERRAEILKTPWQPPRPAYSDENPLPPMWALDLERQLKEEEEAARLAEQKRSEQQRRRRSEQFHENVEDYRARTGWRPR